MSPLYAALSSTEDLPTKGSLHSPSTKDVTPAIPTTRIIRGKSYGLWTSGVHVIPILMTGTILFLAFSNVYWFPTSGIRGTSANAISNWLQLVAKLYELFVVASLAAITLKVYKRYLVGSGSPAGLLSSAYRVGDVRYLVDRRFWAGILDKSVLGLSVLLLVATLLSPLLGPASAILIIPELGWFPLSNPFSEIHMPLLIRTTNLWPQTLHASSINEKKVCSTRGNALSPKCSSGGWSTIYNWASGWYYDKLPDHLDFAAPSGAVRRRMHLWQGDDASYSTFVSSLTVETTNTMGELKSYIKRENVGPLSSVERYRLHLDSSSVNLQPLVNSKCKVWAVGEESNVKTVDYPFTELRCFSGDENSDCNRMKKLLSSEHPDRLDEGDDDSLWSKLSPKDGLLTLFEVVTDDDVSTLVFKAYLPHGGNGDASGAHIATCSYMAHWIASSPSMDSENDLIESNVTDLSVFSSKKDSSKRKVFGSVGQTIHFQEKWTKFVGSYFIDDETKENTVGLPDLFGALTETELDEDGDHRDYFIPGFLPDGNDKSDKSEDKNTDQNDLDTVAQVLEKFTGAIVADAIARTSQSFYAKILRPDENGYNIVTLRTHLFKPETNSKSDGKDAKQDFLTEDEIPGYQKNSTMMDFSAEQYGYGFGNPGSVTTFALVVIFTYLLVLLLYWISVLAFRADTVTTWNDVQDFTILVWSSPSLDVLKGQGATVSDASLWKKKVTARATPSGQVVLALGKDEELAPLKKNEAYW